MLFFCLFGLIVYTELVNWYFQNIYFDLCACLFLEHIKDLIYVSEK